MNDMGGEINVASEKGDGTTFPIVAPCIAPSADDRLTA